MEIIVKIEKDGKVEVKTSGDTRACSRYARVFDESSRYYDKHRSWNLWFLMEQERYANNVLKRKKQLLLNEVLELIGLPTTDYGRFVGWIYDEKNPIGDNYVDFGMHFDKDRKYFILDFNVDGNILDKI